MAGSLKQCAANVQPSRPSPPNPTPYIKAESTLPEPERRYEWTILWIHVEPSGEYRSSGFGKAHSFRGY